MEFVDSFVYSIDMALADIFVGKKREILERCFQAICDTYPPESSPFIRHEKDRFLNPVGSTIRADMEHIFDELIGPMNEERFCKALEDIIKIRAVQGFIPSEAVSFIFFLKKAMSEEITRNAKRESANEKKIPVEELRELEGKIDRIVLLAFDIYMGCREKINELRIKEMKTLHGKG